MRYRKLVIEIICALFIVLWIYTGLNKILDAATFKSQLNKSPFVSPMAGFMTIALPYGELFLAAALVMTRTRTIALYLSFGLMLLFTGYVFLMLNYAYDLPCSCGGIMAKLSWTTHLWFNAVFTLIATIAILFQTNTLSILRRKKASI